MNIPVSHRANTAIVSQLARSSAGFSDVLALGTSVAPWSPALVAGADIAALRNGNITGCYVPSCLREQRPLEDDPTVLSLLADVSRECVQHIGAFRAYAKNHGARHAT